MAESHIVSVQALLDAGAHFGHITRRWNPKMAKFIYGEKNGIHQIDLRKTQLLIDYARDVIFEIASRGQGVLFVGTKANAKATIKEQAERAEIHYVSERWLGGMLTNFMTIRRSINRLSSIDRMENDGTFDNITKKERLLLTRERERLRKVFGGIETMRNIPGCIFVVDARKEHLAVKEARVLGIPVIGIIDTNTDPDSVDYPIPANDESRETTQLITTIIADAVIEGMKNAKIRAKELGYNPNRKEQAMEDERTDRRGGGRGDKRGGDRSDRRGGGRGDRTDRRDGGRGDKTDRRDGGRGDRTDRRDGDDRRTGNRDEKREVDSAVKINTDTSEKIGADNVEKSEVSNIEKKPRRARRVETKPVESESTATTTEPTSEN